MTTTKTLENDRKGEQPAVRTPPIVPSEAWEAARQQMLVKEKALTRARDALAAERRRINIEQGKGSAGRDWIALSWRNYVTHREELGRFEMAALAGRQALNLELDYLRRSAGLARINAVP